jgi:beta-1,4-mannosyl-glycoprotein beta-1,4-N-acetylglucosaminyltransferase
VISDLDEIPRAELVRSFSLSLPEQSEKLMNEAKGKKFKKCSKKTMRPRRDQKVFFANAAQAFEMPIYFYQLNRQPKDWETSGKGAWVGTVMTTYEMVVKFGVQHFRDFRWKLPRVEYGGWHFTWMGGKEKIRTKLGSVVEGSATPERVSDEELDAWIQSHPVVPVDASFPAYVQRNREYLRGIGYLADLTQPAH